MGHSPVQIATPPMPEAPASQSASYRWDGRCASSGAKAVGSTPTTAAILDACGGPCRHIATASPRSASRADHTKIAHQRHDNHCGARRGLSRGVARLSLGASTRPFSQGFEGRGCSAGSTILGRWPPGGIRSSRAARHHGNTLLAPAQPAQLKAFLEIGLSTPMIPAPIIIDAAAGRTTCPSCSAAPEETILKEGADSWPFVAEPVDPPCSTPPDHKPFSPLR